MSHFDKKEVNPSLVHEKVVDFMQKMLEIDEKRKTP